MAHLPVNHLCTAVWKPDTPLYLVLMMAPVITLGAGVQWQEAYDAAFAHNRDIVGGLSMGATVGAAGGWLQGGGHSALSPSYGLGKQ